MLPRELWKLLIDAGFAGARPKIADALAGISSDPIKHLINSHWHFDHTDGNEWLHSAGATILAHENTRKHLSVNTRVEGWDFTFAASPPSAIPGDVFTTERTLDLNGEKISLKHYAPAYTDSDIYVHFTDADIIHVADTFWNGFFQSSSSTCSTTNRLPANGLAAYAVLCEQTTNLSPALCSNADDLVIVALPAIVQMWAKRNRLTASYAIRGPAFSSLVDKGSAWDPIDSAELSAYKPDTLGDREGGENPPLPRNCKRQDESTVCHRDSSWEGSSSPMKRKSGDRPGAGQLL